MNEPVLIWGAGAIGGTGIAGIGIAAMTTTIAAPDIPSPFTIRELFTSYLDVLAPPKRRFLQLLSLFTADEEQREKLEEMCSTEGADLYNDYIVREKRSYIELLAEFPSARPPLNHLISMIPRIQPRQFSISSSQLAHPGEIHLSVGVVRKVTRYGRVRHGLCSSYIAALRPGEGVVVRVKKGQLRLPPSPDTPVIMVGPGTGIAPFRAFVQERKHLNRLLRPGGRQPGTVEKDMVVFGCRHEAKDFLYGDEWRAWDREGTIHLLTAFSRDQDDKVYVQDRLQDGPDLASASGATLPSSALVWQMLAFEGAYCFVAGNTKVPAATREALTQIARREGGLDAVAANQFVKQLEARKRFVIESWG